jgi:3-deoxy-D-manno-octulosonic-acid transferase
VGEGLAAQAVLRALRARRPETQAAFTHFSPSAEAFAASMGADVAAYLPWDVAEAVRQALDGLRPDLLIFTKTEVWPVLVAEAAARAIPVALVAGVVPPGAGRARWPARALLRSTWERLALGCAVTEADAERLVRLGVPEAAVHVTGDPSIDSASGRAEEADPTAPYLAPFHEEPRPTVVAGSTWPEDEAVLIPALAEVREAVPDVRVIIAPHEPDAETVGGLLSRLQGLGWKSRPLSAVESRGSPGDAAAVVVDRVGVLAHMYTVGQVAYVGGGFGTSGLHSVLEPAAARVPVTFGPRHERAPAAAGLMAAGGARSIRDAGSLAAILAEWLRDATAQQDAGARAFAYIDFHSGAADRTAALLDPLLRHLPEHL